METIFWNQNGIIMAKTPRAVSRKKQNTFTLNDVLNWSNVGDKPTTLFGISESRFAELASQIKHPYPVNSDVGILMAIADVKFESPIELACVLFYMFNKHENAWRGATMKFDDGKMKSYVTETRIREYALMVLLTHFGYAAAMEKNESLTK